MIESQMIIIHGPYESNQHPLSIILMVISSDQSQEYITLIHLGEYELLSACIWDEYGGYEPVAARITEGLRYPWFGSTFMGLI